jgi:hypothetical protein
MASPFNLQENISTFVTLYLAVRDAPTKDAVDALDKFFKDFNTQLTGALGAVQTALKNKSDLSAPGPAHDRQIQIIEDAITIAVGADLAKFFSNVSQAVVEAQQELNRQSLAYIKQLPTLKDGQPFIPPSYFAIPSVKAEIKVGVSQVKSKGINIIIFHNEDQKQNFSESTISFEVVSAPPPPSAASVSPQDITTTTSTPSLLAHAAVPLHEKMLFEKAGPKPSVLAAKRAAVSEESMALSELSPPAGEPLPTAAELTEVGFPFAERSSALDEREHLLDIREQWLDVRAKLIGNKAHIIGDKTVLDSIRRQLQARGQELGKLYDNTEDFALILSYTKQDRPGYLVLWPGRAEGDRPETWRELRVFHLVQVGDELIFDTSLFETTPPDDFLLLTSRKDLLAMPPEELANLAINLGDALMNVVLIFNQWLTTEE